MKTPRPLRLLAAPALLVCHFQILTLETVSAQQPESATSVITDEPAPMQVLNDCMDAVKSRDFDRYVDHLTAEEQQIQAGYVIEMAKALSQVETLGGLADEPDMMLLIRAIDDLIRTHAASEAAYERHIAEISNGQQTFVAQMMLAGLIASGNGDGLSAVDLGQSALHGLSAASPKEIALDSSELVKVPRDFLVDVLNEVSHPILVTEGDVTEPVAAPMFDQVVQVMNATQWTVFSRGNYAVATASRRAAGPNDVRSPQSPPGGASADPPLPPLEFKRLNGQWKISKLLPVQMMMPQMSPLWPIASQLPAAPTHSGNAWAAPSGYVTPAPNSAPFDPYANEPPTYGPSLQPTPVPSPYATPPVTPSATPLQQPAALPAPFIRPDPPPVGSTIGPSAWADEADEDPASAATT